MATDTWKDGSDNWTTAADWSTGAPPTATDTADIETGDPQITYNVGTIGSLFLGSAALSIEKGAVDVLQSVYNVSGTLNIDEIPSIVSSGGSVVSIAGTLTNTSAVVIGNYYLTTPTSVRVGAISNQGSITVTGGGASNLPNGQASLSVAGAAGFGTAGTVTGYVELLDNAQISFGSGSLTTIGSNGTLEVEGPQASINISGATGQNSALAELSQVNAGGTLIIDSLSTSASDFINSGAIYAGGSINSRGDFSVAGSFDNYGLLYITDGVFSSSNFIQDGGSVIVGGGTLITSSYNTKNASSLKLTYSDDGPGVVEVNGGNSNISGSINGTGTIDFEGGTAALSADIQGEVSVRLGGDAYVDFATPDTSPTSSITFNSGSEAVLRFDYVYQNVVQNPIVGFAPGDTIDLRSLAYSPDATVNYNASNNILTVTSGGVTDTLSLALPQVTNFRVESDGFGGTQIVCFRTGTRIRTCTGDRAVESLAVGERVITASGEVRPIKWLGHRTIDCSRHPHPREAKPIRIARHAFADNVPARDLFVSPGHAIGVDVAGGVLIPASALVNGTTIAQVEVETVTYWHVELNSHDILLAEGLPAESYLDMGNRDFFAENAVVALDAAPDEAAARQRAHTDFCRPFHEAGLIVDAVRHRLQARAEQLAPTPRRYAAS